MKKLLAFIVVSLIIMAVASSNAAENYKSKTKFKPVKTDMN